MGQPKECHLPAPLLLSYPVPDVSTPTPLCCTLFAGALSGHTLQVCLQAWTTAAGMCWQTPTCALASRSSAAGPLSHRLATPPSNESVFPCSVCARHALFFVRHSLACRCIKHSPKSFNSFRIVACEYCRRCSRMKYHLLLWQCKILQCCAVSFLSCPCRMFLKATMDA